MGSQATEPHRFWEVFMGFAVNGNMGIWRDLSIDKPTPGAAPEPGSAAVAERAVQMVKRLETQARSEVSALLDGIPRVGARPPVGLASQRVAEQPLGSYDGLDYFQSPIATSPSSGAKYKGIQRLINCFGRSTLVARFEQGTSYLVDGKPYTFGTYFGKNGLQSNDESNPDAAKALEDLKEAEARVKANPNALGEFPSASGNEAGPLCPARDPGKTEPWKKLPALTS
jgi:hypothetical protein